MSCCVSDRDKERVRWHLCYTETPGTPGYLAKLGDRAYLEVQLETISSQTALQYLIERLNRCDRALNRSELIPEDRVVGRDVDGDVLQPQSNLIKTETWAGDINRTNTTLNQPDEKTRRRSYNHETDGLAADLGVRNYRTNPFPT